MLNLSKQGNAIYVLYGSKNYTTGRTVVAEIYDEANVKDVTDVTLTEIASTGLYGSTYTPDTLGHWKIKIKEGSQYRAHAYINMASDDIVSVGGEVTSIKDVVENATYGNSALKDMLDDIEGAGFSTGNDSLKSIKDYLVNTIQDSISGISNNVNTAVALPTQMLKPDTGSSVFKAYVNVYSSDGTMEDPDDQDAGAEQAMVQITVVDESGNDRSSNLGGLSASTQGGNDWLTRDSEGRFSFTYSVTSTADVEQLVFTFNYQEGGSARIVDRTSNVTETLDMSTVVQSTNDAVLHATYGLSALKTLIDGYDVTTQADLSTIESKIDTVDSVVDSNNALLSHGTFGLSALR